MKRKNIYRKGALDFLRSALLPVIFTAVVMLIIVLGLQQTAMSSKAEGLKILEDSVRRAVAKCYAVEGSYPESVAYLEEHYGIHIDRTKYVVHYTIIGSNLMPDIMVIEL
jgi:hypothetical protein